MLTEYIKRQEAVDMLCSVFGPYHKPRWPKQVLGPKGTIKTVRKGRYSYAKRSDVVKFVESIQEAQNACGIIE